MDTSTNTKTSNSDNFPDTKGANPRQRKVPQPDMAAEEQAKQDANVKEVAQDKMENGQKINVAGKEHMEDHAAHKPQGCPDGLAKAPEKQSEKAEVKGDVVKQETAGGTKEESDDDNDDDDSDEDDEDDDDDDYDDEWEFGDLRDNGESFFGRDRAR